MPDEVERQLRSLGRRGRRAAVAGVIRDGERECGCWFPRGRPVDTRSLFEIGSITKAFTGVLLADMVLTGEVALEDRLSKHLDTPRPSWRHQEPTLLELATHRSGLPNTPRPLAWRELAYALGVRRTNPWARVTPPEYEHLVAAAAPRRRRGRRVRYSSVAVALLGDALARRAATSYEDLLRGRVLQPLGMDRTAVQLPARMADGLVPGHSRRGKPRPPLDDLMTPAGGLRSCADDMLKFLAACLEPPDARIGAALALAQEPRLRLGRHAAVGLCWMISERRKQPRVVWHNGGTWGYRSFAGFSPDSERAAVVLSNAARGVESIGFRLLA